MDKTTFSTFVLMLIVTILCVCDSVGDIIVDDYEDPIMNMLLNGEILDNEQEEVLGELPTFSEGIWKCGNCDVLDERNLVNRDFYTVDKNVDDNFFQVQVSLPLESAQCITVIADNDIVLHLVSGSCDGSYVTFNMEHATNFTVNVYSL